MDTKIKILHLEDVPTDAELVGIELKRSKLSFERIVVDNKIDYIRAIDEYKPDIILSDHSLPSFDSLEAFEILKKSDLDVPFILITATISEEFAVEIMKNGAADYVLKDRTQRLPNAILNALEKYRLEAERKKYMEEVIANESLLKEAENIANIGGLDIDVKTQFTKWSPGLYHILGLDVGEMEPTFRNFFNCIHPDDAFKVKADLDNALLNLYSISIDFRIKTYKTGDIKYLHAKLLIDRDKYGAPVRVKGFTQDITERKLTEEKIKEASETQAAILNALPPNIVLINEKGKIIAVNESWKKMALFNNLGIPNYGVGYSYMALSEKAIGVDNITSIKIEKGINEVIKGNTKEFVMEYASLGESDWFMIVVAPLADNTHKGAVILHINITDRKLAEASLLKSEANLRTVFENIDLAIVLADANLNVASFNSNASAAMLKHFDKKLRVGSPIISHFPKDRRASIKQHLDLVKEKHQVVAYETSTISENGELEWHDIKWVGVVNHNNENVGVILTFKNITEKKNIESERENMTADLAQRIKDLEQFNYIISHNLRAPVANIQGLAMLLADMQPGMPESLETLRALGISVDNLDKVILDLNQILQVRSQVNDQIECVSLPLLVDEIAVGIEQMIVKNKVEIITDFDEMDELYTLKSYVYSILQNLVVNSIKYRRPDADPVITITSKVKGERLLISFKDNGRGIDLQKNGSHVFGLYKRFDWSVEGKGIGLFMVKMQMESLGGSINVRSEVNVGTEFTLQFPLSVKWNAPVTVR
ncbi:PAS domain S-box protein [Mucilaginibacter corticis]|uniref:histidine kinase n=1 Tax=Mucilaginibacter corticis TaxID=2597670 RepID=A0A556MLC4_9SPHI|nr:PAS domain S-box protein [Mucilaginibacter corticis]TSJ40731.1 PAS domain S-box protein [Mucilaginibacter corticis]